MNVEINRNDYNGDAQQALQEISADISRDSLKENGTQRKQLEINR